MTESTLLIDASWAEHPHHALPAGLLEVAEGGTISSELTRLKVRMSAQRYPDGKEVHFSSHLGNTLGASF